MTKLRYAATLAAAIAFMTIRQADRAGLGVFADRLLRHVPTGGTWPHMMRLCQTLEQTQPVMRRGDLGAALRQAHSLMKRRGLIVLISDLLDDPADLFDGLKIPIVTNFPIGHGREMWTLPFGVPATLDAEAKTIQLKHCGVV